MCELFDIVVKAELDMTVLILYHADILMNQANGVLTYMRDRLSQRQLGFNSQPMLC